MKKLLLTGTALVAFGAVSAQAADPLTFGVSGYINENVGFVDNSSFDAKTNPSGGAVPASQHKVSVNQTDDAQLTFKGTIKLDTGLTVTGDIDLYNQNGVNSRGSTSSCGRTGVLGQAAENPVAVVTSVTTVAGVTTTKYSTVNASTGATAANAGAFAATANNTFCSDNNVIKRSFVTVGSDFGQLTLGGREDITVVAHNSAPGVGPNGPLGDSQWYYWVNPPGNHHVYVADNDSYMTARTTFKTGYVSPSFMGLAVIAGYVPQTSKQSGGNATSIPGNADFITLGQAGAFNQTSLGGDLYLGGLTYNNVIQGVTIKADGSVGQWNLANMRTYTGGFNLGYAGFTLGGGLLVRQVPSNAVVNQILVNYGTVTPSALAQGILYAGSTASLGAKFETGPYGFSVDYLQDRSANVSGNATDSIVLGTAPATFTQTLGFGNGTGKTDVTKVYEVAGSYKAGPGVTFRASVMYADYQSGSVSAALLNGAAFYNYQNHGTAVVTGVRLDF